VRGLFSLICLSFSQFVGDFAPVLRQFLHDLLMQPDVHRCGIVFVAGVMQFVSELFARREVADFGGACPGDGAGAAGADGPAAGAALACLKIVEMMLPSTLIASSMRL